VVPRPPGGPLLQHGEGPPPAGLAACVLEVAGRPLGAAVAFVLAAHGLRSNTVSHDPDASRWSRGSERHLGEQTAAPRAAGQLAAGGAVGTLGLTVRTHHGSELLLEQQQHVNSRTFNLCLPITAFLKLKKIKSAT